MHKIRIFCRMLTSLIEMYHTYGCGQLQGCKGDVVLSHAVVYFPCPCTNARMTSNRLLNLSPC